MADDACTSVPASHDILLQALTKQLQTAGLDICHPFLAQLFNTQSPPEHQLPTFGRSSTLAVVIGNSNRLWRPFVAALAHNDSLLGSEDNPLDAFVEQEVSNAVQQAVSSYHHSAGIQYSLTSNPLQTAVQPTSASLKYELRFSPHTESSKFVNMLRAAQLSGLAYYSSITHLCMHPKYGPWFALRAVAVFDCDGTIARGFQQLPCPYPDLEAKAAAAMKQLEAKGGLANWQQHWREWAELRSIGGAYTDAK